MATSIFTTNFSARWYGSTFHTGVETFGYVDASTAHNAFRRMVLSSGETILPGATITSAYFNGISLTDFNYSDTLTVYICCENLDTPELPSDASSANSLSSNVTSSVGWSISDPWSSGESINSPDISSAIQEVVNRPGFNGNFGIFILAGPLVNYGNARGFSGNNSTLYIEYENPSSSSSKSSSSTSWSSSSKSSSSKSSSSESSSSSSWSYNDPSWFKKSVSFDSDDLYSTTKLFYSRTGLTNFKEAKIFDSDDLYSTTKLFYSRTGLTKFKEAKLKDVSKGHPKRQYGGD